LSVSAAYFGVTATLVALVMVTVAVAVAGVLPLAPGQVSV